VAPWVARGPSDAAFRVDGCLFAREREFAGNVRERPIRRFSKVRMTGKDHYYNIVKLAALGGIADY
jgi:hypothetical protein